MKTLLALVACVALGCANQSKPVAPTASASSASPGSSGSPGSSAPRVTADKSGLGNHHHAVSTSNPEAQRAFDNGLVLVYGFNHEEAIRSFERALQLDPNLAMAHWGIALALGPNYNIDVDPPREKAAYEHIQQAKKLAGNVSMPEKDYIDALAARYSNDEKPDLQKLAHDYAKAMKALSQKYPDDLDAATLYADSMMVLKPWKLYTHDGKPVEGTEEIVMTLESVLKRDPDHVGANHLYIHATEGSTSPQRALDAANRLPGLAPAAGHLVHMPSHVYIRTGDYEAASNTNVAAVEVDEEYLKTNPPTGPYSMMYYPHNIHFVAVSRGIEGRSAESIAAAKKLADYVRPHVAHMPPLEGFIPVQEFVLVRFHKWDDVMKLPEPDKSLAITHAAWHFARGMALATKRDVAGATRELDAMRAEVKAIPADAPYGMLNRAHDVAAVAEKYLQARIALAQDDTSTAITLLREASKLEDKLNYAEPPDWILPTREALGSVLMRTGAFSEAEETFRDELKVNPRSGRALLGLRESLKKQGKNYDAQMVDQQFTEAWKNADVKIDVMDL